MNESTGKCHGFAFVLVPEHVQKEILKLNGTTLENRIIVIEDVTSTRTRDRKICKKILNLPLKLPKTPRKSRYFSSSKFSAGIKTYVGTFRSKEMKKFYIIGESHLKRIRKDKFKESKPKARVYAKPFSGRNTNQLDYYEVPSLLMKNPIMW